MEKVYEQFFVLKLHAGWSFIEAYNLPVGLRLWFVDKLAEHFEQRKEAIEDSS
jgi:hypothetical protein